MLNFCFNYTYVSTYIFSSKKIAVKYYLEIVQITTCFSSPHANQEKTQPKPLPGKNAWFMHLYNEIQFKQHYHFLSIYQHHNHFQHHYHNLHCYFLLWICNRWRSRSSSRRNINNEYNIIIINNIVIYSHHLLDVYKEKKKKDLFILFFFYM